MIIYIFIVLLIILCASISLYLILKPTQQSIVTTRVPTTPVPTTRSPTTPVTTTRSPTTPVTTTRSPTTSVPTTTVSTFTTPVPSTLVQTNPVTFKYTNFKNDGNTYTLYSDPIGVEDFGICIVKTNNAKTVLIYYLKDIATLITHELQKINISGLMLNTDFSNKTQSIENKVKKSIPVNELNTLYCATDKFLPSINNIPVSNNEIQLVSGECGIILGKASDGNDTIFIFEFTTNVTRPTYTILNNIANFSIQTIISDVLSFQGNTLQIYNKYLFTDSSTIFTQVQNTTNTINLLEITDGQCGIIIVKGGSGTIKISLFEWTGNVTTATITDIHIDANDANSNSKINLNLDNTTITFQSNDITSQFAWYSFILAQ